jgi:Fe-S oxidoreductase
VAVAVDNEALLTDFYALADRCRQCFQCGQCTSGCPSARSLQEGPRRLMRLVLAYDVEAVMTSDDLWRCSECGKCTDACPMEVEPAKIIAELRNLERKYGGQTCPERHAADIATRRLEKYDRIDNLAFGMTMASKGHVPKDVVGAAGAVAKIVGQSFGGKRAAGHTPATAARPFYAGCSLPQDHEARKLTHKVAATLGMPLAEASGAPCCGHPSRGAVPTSFVCDERVLTACPACDAGLREAGIATTPLWEALVDQAQRDGHALTAAGEAFVPYVGCLGARDTALAALEQAAALAGTRIERAYPSLHAACCGALGGMYRGESDGARRLLDFAVEKQAPVVTTCLLCRDNLRSAARRRHLPVKIHFWPEFFSAGPADTPEGATDD